MTFMTRDEIKAHAPYRLPKDGSTPMERARQRMVDTGQWTPTQSMGRRWTIGCVALEITQRCNLDCTLCYLSENSEAVKDIPLQEIYRRIDTIYEMYGPNTDVQVTGGDPTLRKRSELVDIVRRVRDKGMRPSLFTNGIKATRDLLTELVDAGLVDVAFHVDTTQERKGYATEVELNEIRLDYIGRARGLPLSVFFNTTAHTGNFHEIPAIVEFFVKHSDVVRLASFQLQADIGRGTQRERDVIINVDTIADQIQQGAKAPIKFDTPGAGHSACNRYAMTLVANGRVHDLFDDKEFMTDILSATAHLQFDRNHRRKALETLGSWIMQNPKVLATGCGWVSKKLWAIKSDLVVGRGKVGKLSFFIHNFMDACQLDRERIDACVFMVATANGPISMCLHNAKRDDFILQPVQVQTLEGEMLWDPLSGKMNDAVPGDREIRHNPRNLKGRMKEAAVQAKTEKEAQLV